MLILATTHESVRSVRRYKNRNQPKANGKITKAEVRSMIRANNSLVIEKRVCIFSSAAGTTSSGTMHNLLNPLVRGDLAVNNFQGQYLRPQSLRIRAEWSTNQVYSTCRFIVFQWDEALNPTPSGVLATTGSALAPFSPILWLNKLKIKVLYDELTTLFPVSGSSAATNFHVNVQSGFKTIGMNTAGNFPQTNGLFALAITDDLIASFPNLNFYSEVIFTDA